MRLQNTQQKKFPESFGFHTVLHCHLALLPVFLPRCKILHPRKVQSRSCKTADAFEGTLLFFPADILHGRHSLHRIPLPEAVLHQSYSHNLLKTLLPGRSSPLSSPFRSRSDKRFFSLYTSRYPLGVTM